MTASSFLHSDMNMPKAAVKSPVFQTENRQKVREAAVKFEAMFLNEMFSHMFEGIDENNPLGGGHGEKVFRSMMVDQYAQLTAKTGQTKIAVTLEREILRMQEEQRNPRGNVIMPTQLSSL